MYHCNHVLFGCIHLEISLPLRSKQSKKNANKVGGHVKAKVVKIETYLKVNDILHCLVYVHTHATCDVRHATVTFLLQIYFLGHCSHTGDMQHAAAINLPI